MLIYLVAGVIIGGVAVWWFTRGDSSSPLQNDDVVINPEQVAKRQEHLEKVLAIARQKGEIANDDVQKALAVSDATAERYLAELEKQGKLEQVGERGVRVRYRIK